MALLEDLKWRYATKKMNGVKISQENLDYILEAARLAPSSSGLYKSTVILPLGYRDSENDWLVKMKKVRTPKEEFITEIS